MPELSRDDFGDSLAREIFFLGKSPLDHDHADHRSLQNQQEFFRGTHYSFQDTFKPPQQEKQKIVPGMSPSCRLSLPQPDAFLRHASSFLPLDIDTCFDQQFQNPQKHQHHYPQQQQQTLSAFLPGSGLLHQQSMQLEVPEIEDCNTSWISEVLNDFPAINTEAELPPLVSPSTNASFDRIPLTRDFWSNPGPICQIPMSTQQPQYAAGLKLSSDRSRPARPCESKLTVPPTNPSRAYNKGVRIQEAPGVPGSNVSYKLLESSTTAPKHFSPRISVSRRYQRVSEKSKEVSHMEKLDHVQRERQRRNAMSCKISTLESLLPPVGLNLKRDRAAIVHDSVQYLKFLQARVEELKGTFAEMKHKSSTTWAARQTAMLKKGNPELPACSKGKSRLVEYSVLVKGDAEVPVKLEKCRCRPDFMSSAMKILEYFNLDVCRCDVTKTFDHTICVIIAKPRLTASNGVASSASVVSAFRSYLQLS